MGWTSYAWSGSIKDAIIRELGGPERVLDISRTADPSERGSHDATPYFAAVRVDDGRIIGVCTLAGRQDGELFVKHMDESMGPGYVGCPQRIYDLLTDHELSDYATGWRDNVEQFHAKQAELADLHDGQTVRFARPLANGQDTFEVVRTDRHGRPDPNGRARRFRSTVDGMLYHVKGYTTCRIYPA